MNIKMNSGFGPAWEVIDSDGRAVACAHIHADAVAFAEGRMTAGELDRKNERIERNERKVA